MLDVLDNFLWVLRREGFTLSTAQAIEAARAAREVGLSDRLLLRDAIACVVVDDHAQRARYDELFDEFFSLEVRRRPDLPTRLLAQGFSRAELRALRELLGDFLSPEGRARLRALLSGGTDLDHLLASEAVKKQLLRLNGPLQKGFFAHQLMDELGIDRARSALAFLKEGLTESLGAPRAEELVRALLGELERSEQRIRERVDKHVAATVAAEQAAEGPMSMPFALLAESEIDEVRRGVRKLAERLRGAARVKSRHRRKGRIDPARTMRKSLTSGGVPFRLVRRDQRRERPRLVVLCDVSDSVRQASRFMLEFVYAVQELFERTRSFVFVSEIAEVTRLFQEKGVSAEVLEAALSSVDTAHNSYYGRALLHFEQQFMSAIDRRTTVVILGDGRTNYQATGADVVAEMRVRAQSVLWLCPEPRSRWGAGDSSMPAFAAEVTQALVVASGADLERAARELVVRV
ncbi:MAG TPA: VWA domain-containing protein [Polyangiaceae bacterium]|nr:VWA domain-containing protein [Polyangiaceae bacterium]